MTAVTTPRHVPSAQASSAARDRTVMVAFVVTSLLGSALLFLVQPMVGRLLLPRAGGSASLWNTAMVFFQCTLLAGYLLAHVGTRKLGVGRHRLVHVGFLLLPLLVLPLAVPGGWSLDADRPVIATLSVLATMVGLPFLALATASPTLQRWFANTGHPDRDDPYFLYAAGNIGSIGALLGYPLIIEPRLGLSAQTRLFTGLYVAFVVATAACAFVTRPDRLAILPTTTTTTSTSTHARTAVTAIGWSRRLRWVAWAAIPSALLLGVTRHLSTDIASFPLLWALPLTLYLLSYVVAFGDRSERRLPLISTLVRLGVVLLLLSLLTESFVFILVVHLGWFFAAATLAHLRLAVDRPPVERLTEFYAWLSVGGALGGGLVALVAPLIFDRVWEYPLAIVAAIALARPVRGVAEPAMARATSSRIAGGLVFTALLGAAAVLQTNGSTGYVPLLVALAALVAYVVTATAAVHAATVAALLAVIVVLEPADVVHYDRSFFGTYEVHQTAIGVELVSGTTVHGRQRAADPHTPSSYYHPTGPVGDVLGGDRGPIDVAVIGLGAGEMTTYAQVGDRFLYYEIDPVVVEIASDTSLFTHLSSSEAEVDIEVGDGRILMENSRERHDVVVIDAFSSDAIPVHLLTVEAVAAYLDHADDVVLFHISNRYFDLAPVLGRAAEAVGVDARIEYFTPDPDARASGANPAIWVALLPDGSQADLDSDWRALEPGGRLWTDDYSDILGTLNW